MRQPRHASALISEALNIPDPADQPSPESGSVECPKPNRFGFMFPELQTQEALLPEGQDTVRALVRLGKTMIDNQPLDPAFDSDIPSIYTYFGQFVVHDMTFDAKSNTRLFEEDLDLLKPLSVEEINAIDNPRSGLLDLDSVYGPILENDKCYPVPLVGNRMKVELAVNANVLGTDLPRAELPPYKARIGDHRNDENIVLSQLHLAFLNAHNVLVNANASYEEARAFLRRRYQQLVLNDFLPRIVADEDIKWAEANRIFNPPADGYFMPVEFSAGAFRFGHAMIRSDYFYNQVRETVQLYELFTLKALTSYHHILADWIVDWNHFVPGGVNVARNLAPRVVEPLAEFLSAGITVPVNGGALKRPVLNLAVIDLIRGYLFRLPTGQAIAEKLGVAPMTDAQIEHVALAVSNDQFKVLQESDLLKRTPLWYYILAESADPRHGNGNRLGPVGGRLVASVLLEARRRSQDALLNEDGWDPILGEENDFDLGELLRRSKV